MKLFNIKKMEFELKSVLIFDKNSLIQLDNYYLNKIIDISHKTYKNKYWFKPCNIEINFFYYLYIIFIYEFNLG